METRIKSVKLIPEDTEEFKKNIHSKKLDNKYKEFILGLLETKTCYVCDIMDNFYIDYPYKWNFYNYTQKFKSQEKLVCHRMGWDINCKETNYSNYDDILIKDGKYIKYKNKVGYHDYYNEIDRIFPWVEQAGNYLIVDYCDDDYIDPFDKSYGKLIIKYLKEMYDLGLWANNINWYSIRLSKAKNKIKTFDPELFFVIKHNKRIQGIDSFESFISTYYHYKLRNKSIHYKIKYNDLDENAIMYLYNSYWILEKMAQAVRTHVNEQ